MLGLRFIAVEFPVAYGVFRLEKLYAIRNPDRARHSHLKRTRMVSYQQAGSLHPQHSNLSYNYWSLS